MCFLFCVNIYNYCFRNARTFHEPLTSDALDHLTKKTFSSETMKKVNWAKGMFQEWRSHRNKKEGFSDIHCDLDNLSTINVESLIFALCRFITEVKKLDGCDFPPKTLYEILVCLQFYLETEGFSWHLISDEVFKDVKFTLDNTMKQCTEAGLGNNVRQAEVLSISDEDILWNLGLLGTYSPEVLLVTVMYSIGLSCSLRAGKEHHVLGSIPFDSQFTFFNDKDGKLFFRYREDLGLKTNKGGLKHRKVPGKVVDVHQIDNVDRCPVHILSKYLSMLPSERKCKALYLQCKKNYSPGNWYRDAPVGENKMRSFVKDLCKKAGIPGFYSNHSLRSTSCTRMYDCGVDEQVIQEISGHRSLAVRSYKRTSDEKRRKATKSIFGECK